MHSARIKNRLNRFFCCENENHFYDEDKLEKALEAVDQARDISEANNELKPFKVLGFPAQSALTISIISTALSFYMIIFSFYSSGPTSLTQAAVEAGFR